MAEYFEAYAEQSPSQLERAAAAAAPDSLAHGYAMHRANLVSAALDNGHEWAEDTLGSLDEEQVRICDSEGTCTTFGDFTFKKGKLATFAVDGVPIADRLVVGDGTVQRHGKVAGFELLSAYQSAQSGGLTAVFRYIAYERPIRTSYVAKYRAPDGRQVQDEQSMIPSTVAPESHQLGTVLFPRAEVGGDFFLKFASEDDGPLVVETLTIPTVDLTLPK